MERLECRCVLAADPIINEFLASNSEVIQDEDGDYSDYIELYNRGDTAADLTGWYLTDDAGNLTKWELPATTLEAGEYLVVFASSKNRAIAGSELHTNFGASVGGEYLALVQADGATIATEFSPGFPQQFSDISYGFADVYEDDVLVGQELRYLVSPTPGGPNGEGWLGFVAQVDASVAHGFFDDEFPLALQTATPDAQIYYSYDGSVPGPDNAASVLYADPIIIDTTTVLRAAAYRDDYAHSPVITQTYVFVEDVIGQSITPTVPANNPFGLTYPSYWGGRLADYNMDPSIVSTWDDLNPANDDFGIREGLLSLPTMSIVMDHADLWNGTTGIYPNSKEEGDEWRRPGSIEYFDPSGAENFQYNVGVQIHGGGSRAL
jgi:hypothetical protein